MKLWGGRFSQDMNDQVFEFTASMNVDSRLWSVDIQGSIAHALMLGKQKILTDSEAQTLVQGLKEIHSEIESGNISLNPGAEDIHSEIETLLTKKVGPVAGKLHSARSRNDQVTTDTRIYLREQVAELQKTIRALQQTLLSTADQHKETILPGFTHMQPAQPVSLAHHLLAYFWMLDRDYDRLKDSISRINRLPLGSAALAGTGFPIDRQFVAKHLNFEGVTENSLDSVSDRDYVIEFLSNASTIMMHLSRFSEELILWSSPAYGFVELGDDVTTGSSIMPQKKNPDVAELIRGRTGKLFGHLTAALTLMKGLPLSYNRDMQEDKPLLFEGLDVTHSSLKLMNLMLTKADWKKEKMSQALKGDFSNATDLADDLVLKGLPFREAHEIIGKVVSFCLQNKVALEDISLNQLQEFSPLFDTKSIQKLPHIQVLRARQSEGGTSPQAVAAQIEKASKKLKA